MPVSAQLNPGNILYLNYRLPCFKNKGLEQFLIKQIFREKGHPLGFFYYAPHRLSNATVNYIIYSDGIWHLRNSVRFIRHRNQKIDLVNSWSITVHCSLKDTPIKSVSLDENGNLRTRHSNNEDWIWNGQDFMPSAFKYYNLL